MSDADDDFDKAFDGFGEDPKTPVTPPAESPKAEEPTPPAAPAPDAPKEEPKKDEQPATPPVEPPKKDDDKEEVTPPAADAPKTEEGAKPPETPETPPPAEEPKPLTKEDVTSIIHNIRTDERASGKELENTTQEVMEAYYPEGLSNDLIDQRSGKVLKTPEDVVAATDGQMTTDEAAQWLMNEQFKLDTEITRIKGDAAKIAETTVNFKRDSIAALQKYEPLFKAYPQLQEKSFNLLMKQVKADKDKGVILAAPDVMDLYDTYLEPYQQAYEFSTKQPATAAPPAAPAPPTPGAEDRMDEGGDGGQTPPNDPTDFAQQVSKELAKGI